MEKESKRRVEAYSVAQYPKNNPSVGGICTHVRENSEKQAQKNPPIISFDPMCFSRSL